jgi:hypothetical protein
MKPTIKRLAALAALGTMGIVAPVSSASAAVTPGLPGFGLPGFGLPVPQLPLTGGLWGSPVSYVAPGVLGAAVVGPVVITTAPSVFNNTNIQVSAGSNLSGGQVG